MSPITPTPWRSSGTRAMPEARAARGDQAPAARPSIASVPASGASVPESTSASAAWPLPETPAMPVISPPRSVRSMGPRPPTVTPFISTSAGPGCAGPMSGRAISAPTISSASAWRSVSAVARSPTSRPARSTRTRSLTAMTSPSLWEMKMIASPRATSRRRVAKSASDSCGVSTAVGSSRMSTRASR